MRCLLAADLEVCDDLPREPADLLEADRAHYAQIANSLPGGGGQGGVAPLVPLADTFLLHSRPTATKVIYLDFDGFTAAGTPWNTSNGRDPILSPAWDPDGDGAAFSNAELMRIQGVWQRVANDYSAFDIDVTTEDPGEAALVKDGSGDTHWGIRVVFTPDDFPAPGTGGVAYINSFTWGYRSQGSTDTPVYVFNQAEMPAAVAASHEVGHSLGLSHDGTTDQHPTQPSAGYYHGHGTGETAWGPIMGSGYYVNVTTWDNGVYFASNNGDSSANYGSGPDDLQIITGNNGFTYIPDVESNSLTASQPLSNTVDYGTGLASISQFGIISQSTDVDIFSFQTGSGTVNLDFDPYISQAWVKAPDGTLTRSFEPAYFNSSNWNQNQGTNLDIEATLYDSLGNEVAKSNPNGLRASFSNLQLNSGVYYVKIDGVGFADPTQNPPLGYTDYASLGQYLVTGTVPVALGLVLPPSPVVYVEDTPAVQVAATATVVDAIPGGYASSSLVVSVVAVPGATDRLQLDPTLAGLVVQPDGSIEDGGVVIASIAAATTDTRLSLQLTAGTSAASIVKLVQSVTFEARGDAPDQSSRSVSFQLTKSGLSTSDAIPITVVAVNDAPSVQDAALAAVPEDTLAPAGQTLAAVLGPSFSDPDANSSMAGAAIVNNGTPITQGRWQIAFSKFGPWLDVPAVSSTNRLALSSATLIRFVPAADFNGDVDPIQVQVIDNSYSGAFSSTGNLIYLSAALVGPTSPVSTAVGNLSTNITPVNDAPRPQVADLRFSVTQDQPLAAQIPAGAVIDIDDTVLSYSATLSGGAALPKWLHVNSATASFEGTPGPFDVRNLELTLTVRDPSGASATLPVFIDVINVNDAPTDLRYVGDHIKENAFGLKIGSLSGFDPDGDNFFWTSSDSRFVIRDGDIFLTSPLDYENAAQRQVPVTFQATDVGSPAKSSALDVLFVVDDVNEFYPALTSRAYTIVDGSPVGTVVDLLNASDGDFGQTVRYRLSSGDVSAFAIDAATGLLTLAQAADLQQSSQYKVFVQAYDDGTPSFSTTAQFTINVEPANFYPPGFAAGQVLSFAENLSAGTLVGYVDVSDPDGNPLQYQLLDVVGGNASWVTVDSNSGAVTLNAGHGFDFESPNSFALRVRVVETLAGGNVVTGLVPIQLTDANDRPTGLSQVAVYPNRAGTVVNSDFQVIDQDPALAGYSFSTSDNRFEIRNGRLALRSDQFVASSLVGQTLQVPVRVTDLGDSSSFADLIATVQVVAAAPWQNPLNNLDTTRDGRVTSSDALAVINMLNDSSVDARRLSSPRTQSELSFADVDVSGDNFLSPADALLIINELNLQAGGEGEGEFTTAEDPLMASIDPSLWYSAFSQLENESAVRRRK